MQAYRIVRPVYLKRFSSRKLFTNIFKDKNGSATGLFGYSSLKTPMDFQKMNESVRATCAVLLQQTMKGSTDRTTLQLLDDLSNEICKAADLIECVRQLHSDPKFGLAAEESSRDFCELIESLNTFTGLYERIKQSLDSEKERLDAIDRRTLELYLDDFQQSGVHLPEKEKADYVRLSQEIFDAASKYQWGCDQAVQIDRADQVKYRLSSKWLHSPVALSHDRNIRKFVYTSFYQHIDEQESSLRDLISKRHELAQLAGYESFSHRAQYNSLLGSYENAKEFLWGVIEACRPAAQKEVTVLLDVLGQCEPGQSRVAEWDVGYLSDLYKERAFGTNSFHTASHFLTLGNLLNGFGKIIESLYGIRLEEQRIQVGEMWSGIVLKFAAIDISNNNLLGHIYMDIERRPRKAIGDCHYTVRCSKELSNGQWQTPIVVLSLTLAEGSVKDWAQIVVTPTSAETLFHELGHGIHSMLGRTKYQHVAGTRCPQDFSEIPSNLMECFFNDPKVMQRVLKDKTGTGISFEDWATLISCRFAFTSIDTVQQAMYSLFDLELHGPEAQKIKNGSITTTELFHSISKIAIPYLERDPNTAFHHRFSHFIQYGGKYYSYLVARSAANLIWNSTFRDDPFSRKNGLRWAEVQSHGGGLPPNILLNSILGYSPKPKHLIAAIQEKAANVSCLGAVSI